MFELKISGIVEARRWVEGRWPTHVISLINPHDQLEFEHKNHYIGRMHDVVSQLDPAWILPNESHLDEIFEFTKDLKAGDKLLVHCRQGISRSTAVSIGILMQHGFDHNAAYEYVRNVRDILLPNIKIVDMLDSRFNLNGELVKRVGEDRVRNLRENFGEEALDQDHDTLVAMRDILEKLNKIG